MEDLTVRISREYCLSFVLHHWLDTKKVQTHAG
jgi:hypothetical protein